VSVGPLCGSPVWPSPPVVGPLWGPPLCVGPLCGTPVRVPCGGPLWGSPLCGSPVWVPCVGLSSRCVSCGIYSRDVSRSFTRSRSCCVRGGGVFREINSSIVGYGLTRPPQRANASATLSSLRFKAKRVRRVTLDKIGG